MLKSNFCDYSDAYILVTGTISIEIITVALAALNNRKKIFKNCAPFTNCISELNSTQVDNVRHCFSNIYV